MPAKPTIKPDVHRRQVTAYRGELKHYKVYAEALERVLKAACKPELFEAVVQARAKSPSSFAEKCARKFDKYPDPVRDLKDLCGARVVVQTLNQVKAVRRFVERNFTVVENEDIGIRLGEDKFGYRDRHYIIQLRRDRARVIGFTKQEIRMIAGRKAELQIRTWAQHAWADTLHDRAYKSPLKPTSEAMRTVALLAALMEDGDRNFDRLAGKLDGMVANYAAYADRKQVEDEVKFQQFLFANESDPSHRLTLALRVARLQAALGMHEQVIALLTPYANAHSPLQDELRLELGTTLCRRHRSAWSSPAYQRGVAMIRSVAEHLANLEDAVVLNLRRRDSLQARALSRLAWAVEVDDSLASSADSARARAFEIEPDNPYYLADMLGFDLRGGANLETLSGCMRPAMLHALHECESHAVQGIELPFSFFTAGRLSLLLGKRETALQHYLRGAHHCLDEKACYGCEVIDDEIAWLHRITSGRKLPEYFQFTKDFMLMAKASKSCANPSALARPHSSTPLARITGPVLIIAGGAASIGTKTLNQLYGPLLDALREFRGTVISGGTRSGVPGLVGKIASVLKKDRAKHFKLLGYRPDQLPDDAPQDARYDEAVRIGETGFTPTQILANWTDIIAGGIDPSTVRLLGIGGGPVAALEYRMALAMGASVGIVQIPKGLNEPADEGDAILADPEWKEFPNLLPLPFDAKTLRAFLVSKDFAFTPVELDAMAQEFHARYRIQSARKIKPDSLKPWEYLDETYLKANREQAAYAIRILEAAGFGVRKVKCKPKEFKGFSEADIERMAELEHGRWNIERLRDGWRPGQRDDTRKIHDCMMPWEELSDGPEGVKRYDREAVAAFPAILAKAGLEVFRR